jgi:hypothetical protein
MLAMSYKKNRDTAGTFPIARRAYKAIEDGADVRQLPGAQADSRFDPFRVLALQRLKSAENRLLRELKSDV